MFITASLFSEYHPRKDLKKVPILKMVRIRGKTAKMIKKRKKTTTQKQKMMARKKNPGSAIL